MATKADCFVNFHEYSISVCPLRSVFIFKALFPWYTSSVPLPLIVIHSSSELHYNGNALEIDTNIDISYLTRNSPTLNLDAG